LAIGQPQNEKLVQLVAKLKGAAGAHIASVVLYGSAVSEATRDDFQPEFSDLNVLIVMRTSDAASLKPLQPVVRWWRQQGEPAPVILTVNELRQAADVFAIELLDMKERHRVLDGEDLLSVIDVPRAMHRTQVERELRTAILKLRQRYVESADEQAVSRLMTDSVSTFATLFRHALMIFGQTPAMDKRSAIEAVGSYLSVEVAAMLKVLEIREKRAPAASCNEMFADYLATAERVTYEVDRRLG
jgi:hypothetical protein